MKISVNSTPLSKLSQYFELIKKNSVNYNWSNSNIVKRLKYWMIVRGKASNKSQQSKWSNSNFTFLFAYSFALLSRAKCSCLWSSNHGVQSNEILSEGAFSFSIFYFFMRNKCLWWFILNSKNLKLKKKTPENATKNAPAERILSNCSIPKAMGTISKTILFTHAT